VKGDTRAAWSVALGVLATLTIPVAVVATRYSGAYDLVHSALSIPVAMVLGIAAVILARRARQGARATLGPSAGARAARAGRLLGILGICVAASATISVAVYGLLLTID
jgi:hypothetical protein